MNEEQLEFLISRHVDGDLSVQEQTALQARLLTDPKARQLLEDYRKLNRMVVAHNASVSFDAVALKASINDAIDENNSRSYKLPGRFKALPIALAATLMFASLIGYILINQNTQDTGKPSPTIAGATSVPTTATTGSEVLAQVDTKEPAVVASIVGQPIGVPFSTLANLMLADLREAQTSLTRENLNTSVDSPTTQQR
jgi:anti-sigma factor RsiW